MAKKKKQKKEKASEGKNKLNIYLMLLFLVVVSAVFFSSAILFYIGLVPAFVAFFVDNTKAKSKAMTVGSFNIIGCMPFAIDLWRTDGSLDIALNIILNPMNIVIVYFIAGVGYVIYWSVATVVSGVLYQQGVARRKEIAKRKKELLDRWGQDVAGEAKGNMPLKF